VWTFSGWVGQSREDLFECLTFRGLSPFPNSIRTPSRRSRREIGPKGAETKRSWKKIFLSSSSQFAFPSFLSLSLSLLSLAGLGWGESVLMLGESITHTIQDLNTFSSYSRPVSNGTFLRAEQGTPAGLQLPSAPKHGMRSNARSQSGSSRTKQENNKSYNRLVRAEGGRRKNGESVSLPPHHRPPTKRNSVLIKS